MKPGKVNSHIQMPRFLLARFENERHSFYYFDVENRFIGTNGHAAKVNIRNFLNLHARTAAGKRLIRADGC